MIDSDLSTTGYHQLRKRVAQRRTPKMARLPPWSLTFADLMMLLLTFFVMLSSLSEMDKEKYRLLSVSLASQIQGRATAMSSKLDTPVLPDRLAGQSFEQWVALSLKSEQDNKSIEIERREGQLVLRIEERLAFPSASAEIYTGFRPILAKIAQILKQTDGRVVVAGHTDNVPIRTFRFPSNWELSTARAAAVIQELIAQSGLQSSRFIAEGYADTSPLAANDSDAHRAQNRRVEIRVLKPNGDTK